MDLLTVRFNKTHVGTFINLNVAITKSLIAVDFMKCNRSFKQVGASPLGTTEPWKDIKRLTNMFHFHMTFENKLEQVTLGAGFCAKYSFYEKSWIFKSTTRIERYTTVWVLRSRVFYETAASGKNKECFHVVLENS